MNKSRINWEEQKRQRAKESNFDEGYSETHIRTEKISSAPQDGEQFNESGQRASILSDGEQGRLFTHAHKELFRCDCGCVVDSILKTRRDSSGAVFCERHGSFFCHLCSLLIFPTQQVKINEFYYHREGCAEKVLDSVLFEMRMRPEGVSQVLFGELMALKAELRNEKYAKLVAQFKNDMRRLFSRKKINAIPQS